MLEPGVANLSIDRINNYGNYEPGNLRWGTNKQQSRNQRSNVIVELFGESLCFAEAVERFSTVSYAMAYARYRRYNWGLEESLGL